VRTGNSLHLPKRGPAIEAKIMVEGTRLVSRDAIMT
jgi:hypothetical protein